MIARRRPCASRRPSSPASSGSRKRQRPQRRIEVDVGGMNESERHDALIREARPPTSGEVTAAPAPITPWKSRRLAAAGALGHSDRPFRASERRTRASSLVPRQTVGSGLCPATGARHPHPAASRTPRSCAAQSVAARRVARLGAQAAEEPSRARLRQRPAPTRSDGGLRRHRSTARPSLRSAPFDGRLSTAARAMPRRRGCCNMTARLASAQRQCHDHGRGQALRRSHGPRAPDDSGKHLVGQYWFPALGLARLARRTGGSGATPSSGRSRRDFLTRRSRQIVERLWTGRRNRTPMFYPDRN